MGPKARLTGLTVVWIECIWAVERSRAKARAKRVSPSFPEPPRTWALPQLLGAVEVGWHFPHFSLREFLKGHMEKW